MAVVTYIEAISQALREEMQRDERVFCLGEDIGVYGGAFKVTKGFLEEFGEKRIVDTPLAESAIVGAALGAAVMGLRPVAEMQFADFITCGFNQVVNNAAKFHYRTGYPAPMTIRCPSGGGVHGGPFHSQNPEGWFINVPGLKVVAPSTPYDAKGLLKAAVRDENPVIYFEHKYLYRRIKEDLPGDDFVVPIGEAEIKREGSDISIITYGAMVHYSLEAAEVLSQEGVEVEILDLRTLLPYDKDAILATVRKTNKALVVHETSLTGGPGGEFAAFISEHAFEHLDGPVMRVGAMDTPIPYSATLEGYVLPDSEKIVSALRELAEY